MTWILIISAVVMNFAGIAVLSGKFDGVIIGCLSSSKEKRKKYDVKNLRALTACILFGVAAVIGLVVSLSSIIADYF